jgi:hypothetical protein
VNKSESIANIIPALLEARKIIEPIVKTKEANIEGGKANYRFKYAPFEEVLHKITPALNEHGLILSQGMNGFSLETSIFHTSGEWITYSEELPHAFASPRAFGSELSFRKRYAATAALGITAEEDDDGQIAERELNKKRTTAPSGSAAEFMQESFQNLDPKMKEYVKGIAANCVALLEEGRDFEAYSYLEGKKLDDVEKPAVWSLLQSKQRTAIKKAGEQARKLEPAK